jgi:predicted nucleic acid-binding protein
MRGLRISNIVCSRNTGSAGLTASSFMIAFDTNVYAYVLDSSSPEKQAKAVKVLGSVVGAASTRPLLWQVACEYLAYLRRQQAKQRIDATSVEQEISALLSNHRLVLPTPDVIPRALELTRRYSLSHWDSLLLAACILAGIDTLYSEDLSRGMSYDSVTVLNPFKN